MSTAKELLRSSREDRHESHTRPAVREEDVDVLLAQYIDLLNQEGPAGVQVREFLEKHAKNTALMRLVKAAREVQALYHEGYLKK